MNVLVGGVGLISAAVLAAAAGATSSSAATSGRPSNARPGELRLHTDKVVVFKDGHALFVKSASTVANERGEVFTEHVPDQAVLGTFWAFAEGMDIRAMRAERGEPRVRMESSGCASFVDVLRANKGKPVVIGVDRMGKVEEVSATVAQVLELPPVRSPVSVRPYNPLRATASAEWPAGEAQPATAEHELTASAELVALDTEGGRLVLPVSSLRSVTGKGLELHCERRYESTKGEKRLTFELGAGAAGKNVKLRLMYFTPGVRWIPTYRIETGRGTTADIALQAEILNEEEDFEGADLDLVVGVPSFRFKDTVSPLSLEKVMRGALAQAAPALMSQNLALSNASFSTRAGEWRGSDQSEADDAIGTAVTGLSGAQHEDLFVYPVKSASLRKGARMAVPLWRAKAPQRHLYTFTLDTTKADSSRSEMFRVAGSATPVKLEPHSVWHELELTDTSDVPWTTGAAMLLDGAIPLGQEVLPYTAPGARSLVPITLAVDVQARHEEVELDRKQNALSAYNYSFAAVRKKATVTIENLRKEKVVLRATLAAVGKVEKVSDGGQMRQIVAPAGTYGGREQVNPTARVSWELELAPGARRTLSYEVLTYQ